MLSIKLMRMRVIKVEANELISIRKNVEYLGTDVSAKFPKFILLQGVTQRLFYTVLGKILQKVFKKCLIGKEKLIRLNTLVFHAKFQRRQLKMLKSLFRLFPTLETRKGVLLK